MRGAGFSVARLRTVRPDFDNPLTVEQQRYFSETALNSYHAGYVTYDDGTISGLKHKLSN